jgi:hypothetical protein
MSRSLRYLRKNGYVAEKVEQPFNPHSKVRKDLFGFIDLVAVPAAGSDWPQLTMMPADAMRFPWGTVGVQATSGGNGAARVAKVVAEPRLVPWLYGGNRVQVHAWRKLASGRWKVKVTVIRWWVGGSPGDELETIDLDSGTVTRHRPAAIAAL